MTRRGLSPSERVLRARRAAHVLHSRTDPRVTTARARQVFSDRFLDQVDPDRRLPGPERLRRAEAAKRAYFTNLAYLSARRRRLRKPDDPG